LNWKKWLLLAGLLAVGGGASALLAIENNLVNAVIAVGAIGVAWMAAHTQTSLTRRVWLLVTAAGTAAAIAALIAYRSYEGVCTATNALLGRRVVIGTELTDEGRSYKEKNPTEDNDELVAALGALNVDLVWTPASIRRCRIALGVSGALWIPLFGVAVVAATSALRIRPADKSGALRSSKPRVFISYTHDDTATALRLEALFVRHEIEVIIDTVSMTPGERITDFIDRSIRNCDVIVSLISSRGLVSPWVASEAIAGLARNRWGREVVLIACYLDDDWLRPEFRLECTHQIDERLRRIEELLAEYSAKRIDPADLNEEQSRLYDLRNNLGAILARFKNSLSLDVREGVFDASGKRLVTTVLAQGTQSR
jgi:hypothetical protein